MNHYVHLLDGCDCDTHENITTLQSITIHWIGPYPWQTPEQVRSWWARKGGEASAHFIIKDSNVLQCWPITKKAWHTGCIEGNDTSIGIEIIPINEQGQFSKLSIKTLQQLLVSLPELTNLPLLRHYDWTGKSCPAYYTQNGRWHDLLKEIGK